MIWKAKNTITPRILGYHKIEQKITAIENTEMEKCNLKYQTKVKSERTVDQI